MDLPEDVIRFVKEKFQADEQSEALELLNIIGEKKGGIPKSRLIRCALVASKNTMEGLYHYVNLMDIDPRDVIMAGEYKYNDGNPIRVRDLSNPFVESSL